MLAKLGSTGEGVSARAIALLAVMRSRLLQGRSLTMFDGQQELQTKDVVEIVE